MSPDSFVTDVPDPSNGLAAKHGPTGATTALSVSLTLQLLLQLVEEAPVGPLLEDFLWAGLDHPGFVEAQRVEADGVGRVVVSPFAVGDLLQRLDGVVGAVD